MQKYKRGDKNGKNKKRDMNFELLRIISMILIISSHYIIHSGILDTIDKFSINYFFIDFIRALSRISVGLYVLITGYYMVKSKIKIKKLFNTWMIVIFYSVFMCILSLLLKQDVGMKGILKSLLPVSSGLYWFATVYIAIYTLAPFFNILINKINKKQYIILLFILFMYLVVDKTIFTDNRYIDARDGESFIWFAFLYLVAGYIRLYFNKHVNKKICISIILLVSIIIVLLRFLSMKFIGKELERLLYFSNILNFVSLISLFLCFKDVQIKNQKINNIIGKISPLTFGIYLIHDNFYFKPFLWVNLLKVSDFANSKYLILHFVISVILVFTVCGLIEFVRTKIWNLCSKLKLSKKVDNLLDNWNDKFWNVMEEKNEN